jgi:hypothetical protein
MVNGVGSLSAMARRVESPKVFCAGSATAAIRIQKKFLWRAPDKRK